METNDVLFDISYVNLDGDFENQVQELLRHVRLTKEEVEGLQFLFDDLQAALQCLWQGCIVQAFGSIVTGLGIKTSDVDCFVLLPSWLYPPQDDFVKQARNVLSRHRKIFHKIFAIIGAKVPIVKFFHAPTGRHCDVSFKSPAGVQNSKLLAYLLHLDKRVLPLAILIKYWSKVHNIAGTNLMPNYCLTLLVIFYLQQRTILPPISFLQRSVQEMFIDDWNVAFDSVYHVTSNTDSLYKLLGGFFKFYSSYKYQKCVISLFIGQALDREWFSKVDSVPEEFVLYKSNVGRKVCKPIRLETVMCVQDPFEHNRNCAVAVHPRLASTVMSHFETAAQIYEKENETDFLKRLLFVKTKPQAAVRPNKTRGVVKRYRNNQAPKPRQNQQKFKPNFSNNRHKKNW